MPSETSDAQQPWMIIGLGNPGERYADTRHNAGRMVVDALARRAGATFVHHRARAHVAECRIGIGEGGRPGPRVILAYLDSYMNESGGPTGQLTRFFSIPAEHLLIVHDELDIPEHDVRVKRGGGEGGHNGLKSISAYLGTRDYARLRVGIGRPPGRMDVSDFVLAHIPARQRDEFAVTVERAADVVEDIVTLGFTTAQQRAHTASSLSS